MSRSPRKIRWWYSTLLLVQFVCALGCAQRAYHYGDFSAKRRQPPPEEVVVEYGQPHKTLDRLSDAVSWPRRKLTPELPDRRVISEDTTARLTTYLEKNDLTDVHVSVRDYQPRDQWRRLRENKILSPLARYTVGPLSIARYSLFPGRVFGRNDYNPYTNTLSINSEAPALVLQEAAFAKNLRQRALPATYAVASHLPFLAGWHEMDAARELVGYAQAEQDWQLEQDSYREVFPRVGAETLGGATAFVPFWWGGPLVGIAGSAAGGIAGRTALSRRQQERDDEVQQLVENEVTGRVQQASFEKPEATVEEPGRTNKRANRASPHGRRAIYHEDESNRGADEADARE